MVEMLLPFLDLESTSILAQCHELTRHFLLLEAVEGSLGTAVQVVEEIVSTSKPLKEPILCSLASRLSRQQKKITLFDCLTVHVDNIESAEAFKTLMEATSDYSILCTGLEVAQPIGDEGWKLLAEAKKASPKLLLNNLTVVKDNLHEANIEDFKVMWHALIQGGSVRVCDKYFPNFLDDVEIPKTGLDGPGCSR